MCKRVEIMSLAIEKYASKEENYSNSLNVIEDRDIEVLWKVMYSTVYDSIQYY